MHSANFKHKDRLFVFLFGNQDYKELTLSLYNAINNTSYDDPSLITFNMLDNFLYMGVKNDVSFIVSDTINLYEHQSTVNPNMPVRMFSYISRIYNPILENLSDSLFINKPLKIPGPSFVVFYNGEKDIGEYCQLKLSDIFYNPLGTKLELLVDVYNINYGHNKKLMERCQSLKEYSWLIDRIRTNKKQNGDLSEAIGDAIMKLPKSFLIEPIISKHRSEVFEMIFTAESYEQDMEKYWDTVRRYATAEGLEEGRAQGLAEGLAEGKAQGLEEGKAQGLVEGKAQGLTEGRAQGLAEGKAQGLAEGKAQGLSEGRAEGLAEGLEKSKEKVINMLLELGYSKEDAVKMVEEKFR